MKALLHLSWAVGASTGFLLACTGGFASDGDGDTGGNGSGAGNGQAGNSVSSGGGTTNPGGASGGGTTNPSGGATTTNPSGGSTTIIPGAGSTGVAGGALGGTSGVELCIDFPAWDAQTVYPMNSKVYYNGAGYIAGNGGDPNAVNQSLDPAISTWWWQPYACEGEGPVGSGGTGGNP